MWSLLFSLSHSLLLELAIPAVASYVRLKGLKGVMLKEACPISHSGTQKNSVQFSGTCNNKVRRLGPPTLDYPRRGT
jgi:hypothetical protein